MSKSIHIAHLYAKEMNIYGDTGNRTILTRRLEWRGFDVKVSTVGVGEAVPSDCDIILGGGGQDAGQYAVQRDLAQKSVTLTSMANDGVVMLLICGTYQLFGREFVTSNNETIRGIGLLPLVTVAGAKRLIGNVIVESAWGKLVGYENHSGQTLLDDSSMALGTVIKGAGNNGDDNTEGCIFNNVFGSYLHGPLLSKNPEFADALILRVLQKKYGKVTMLEPLDDSLEHMAAQVAMSRPR